MQASTQSDQDTGRSSTTPTPEEGTSASLRMAKSVETLVRGIQDASVVGAGLCAIAITHCGGSTNVNAESTYRIVKRAPSDVGVSFYHLKRVDGVMKVIEETWTPTPQTMVNWLNDHHKGEKIQWIMMYPKN